MCAGQAQRFQAPCHGEQSIFASGGGHQLHAQRQLARPPQRHRQHRATGQPERLGEDAKIGACRHRLAVDLDGGLVDPRCHAGHGRGDQHIHLFPQLRHRSAEPGREALHIQQHLGRLQQACQQAIAHRRVEGIRLRTQRRAMQVRAFDRGHHERRHARGPGLRKFDQTIRAERIGNLEQAGAQFRIEVRIEPTSQPPDAQRGHVNRRQRSIGHHLVHGL